MIANAVPRPTDVSVLVLAKDEEANIDRCLRSVAWARQVVVVDDLSGDGTARVAESLGARVVERRFDTFAGQRNWALDSLEWDSEWILHLDADEVVTPELAAEIRSAVSDSRFDAFRIPAKVIFMGRWLKRSAGYPVYQVRLGRQARLRFEQVGHGQRETLPAHRIGTLREGYEHYSFSKGLDDWFAKHNRYSAAEAALRLEETSGWRLGDLMRADGVERRRALKRLAARLPLQPTLRFLWAYVLCGGVLEGRRGLVYCRLMATYEAMIAAKVAYLRGK